MSLHATQRFKCSVIIFMYIIRCNDQLLTTTKQQQQQKQQREGTASTLHMLADVGTHPEAKRTQQ